MVDYQELDALLRSCEAELRTRPTRSTTLPIRTLRVKDEPPFGKVIAWSYDLPNIDPGAAKRFIDSRLEEVGLRTGLTSWSTDDDGTPMVFWGIEAAQPAPVKEPLERMPGETDG